jgi:hypothetical protein
MAKYDLDKMSDEELFALTRETFSNEQLKKMFEDADKGNCIFHPALYRVRHMFNLDTIENSSETEIETGGQFVEDMADEPLVQSVINYFHFDIEYNRLAEVYKNKFSAVQVGHELDIIVAFITKLNSLYKSSCDKVQTKRNSELQQCRIECNKMRSAMEEEKKKKIADCQESFRQQKVKLDAEKKDAKEKFDDVTTDEITDLKLSMMSSNKTRFFTSEKKKIAEYEEKVRAIEERRKELFQKIVNELDAKKCALDKECEKQVKAIEQKYLIRVEQVDRKYNSLSQSKEKAFDVVQKEKLHSYLNDTICAFFDTNTFANRISMLEGIAKSYDIYTVSKELPQYIYLQDVAYEFKADSLYLVGIIRSTSKNIQKFKILDDKGVFRVPYLVKREEGYSLSADFHSQENENIICEFILKQFMAFPAGKLEAVFIDPQLSAPFSAFSKLGGDDYKRIIDTKIWTSINDIENALLRARERLETLVAGYGAADKAISEREERENFRVIAVADFPNKFSVNALRELETLVKRGPTYGISVVLFLDEEAIKNIDKNQETYVKNILSCLQQIKKDGQGLIFYPNKRMDDVSPEAYRCYWNCERTDVERDAIIQEIASHLGDYKKKEVKAKEIYNDQDDINSWLIKSSKDGLVIPLGTQGKGDIVNLTLGRKGADIRHHVLVEGSTGAGKSVFLHTLICSTIRAYAPNEVQLYLLDYKDGVEFKIYADYELPSFRVVSVQSERAYGAKILDKLVEKMTERYSLFKKALNNFVEPNIEDYRNKTQEIIPRLILIIDEFERLTIENDAITEKVMRNIKLLVEQGRAAGIHVILATQNFSLPSDIMDNMAVRFAFQGSSHLLESGNDGVIQLKDGPEGQVVFNDNGGKTSNNKIFQVAYLGNEKAHMLEILSQIERDDIYKEGISASPQVLYTKIEEHKKHVINQFVQSKQLPAGPLAKSETTYPIMLGNCFDLDEKLSIDLRIAKGSNILIASERESTARNLFDLTLLSVLFADLCCKSTDSHRQNIYYIDFGDPDKRSKLEITQLFKTKLSAQIAYVDIDDSDEDELDEAIKLSAEIIDSLYRKLCNAKETGYIVKNRDFLFLFGINRAHLLDSASKSDLRSFSIYESADVDKNISCMDKLRILCAEGALFGINCIFWSDGYAITAGLLGEHFEASFTQKIVSFMPDDDTKLLVLEKNSSNLGDMGAIFLGKQTSNRKFRIYDSPSTEFVNQFIGAYMSVLE